MCISDPHKGRRGLTNYQGSPPPPFRVQPEIEKFPCFLPLWVDFFSGLPVLQNKVHLGSWFNTRISVLLPHLVGHLTCHLHRRPFVTKSGNDLWSNRNLSTCFSDFSLFEPFWGFPSTPEKEKKKSVLHFWTIS